MFIKKTAWRAVSALLLTLVSFALCCTGCEVDASDSPDKKVTITFEANASDAEGTSEVIIGKEKTTVTIPVCPFTRDGWTFTSWNTKADGSGESYKVGDSFVLKEDLTLYAQWTKDEEPVNPDNPDEPSNPDEPENPDTPADPDKPDTPVNPDDPTDPQNPDNPTDPVNPDNPDTPTNPDTPVDPTNPDNPSEPDNPDKPDNPTNPDTPANPDDPENPSDKPDNPTNPDDPVNPDNPDNPVNPDDPTDPQNPDNPTDPDDPNQGNTDPDEPDTPAVKYFTITFDTDGGSDVKSVTLKENETLTKPKNPTKEGFDFVSWIIAKEGETEVEKGAEFDFSTKITKDYTLKASWTVKKCTIYIDTDGGDKVDPIVVDYGHVITVDEMNSIMNAAKYGYINAGFYAKSGETEIDMTDLLTKGITTDIYIKILWELREFLVFFDADNGCVLADQYIEYTKYATAPADPEKEGYTFKGWYRVTKKIEGEEQVEVISDTPFDFKNTAVTEKINLKALYTLNSYTVTFNPNNGSDATSSKYDYNSFVKKPSDPVREGCKFAGWYQVTVKAEGGINVETISDTPFDFENSVVKSEITLKALWKVEIDSNIEVTLEKISGDDNMQIVVETDDFDMPKTFVATEGYDSYAWYLDGEQMDISSAKIDFNDFVACVDEMVQNGVLEAIEEGGKLMLKGGHHRLQVLAQKNGESFPHSALFDYFITYSALN